MIFWSMINLTSIYSKYVSVDILPNNEKYTVVLRISGHFMRDLAQDSFNIKRFINLIKYSIISF